MFGRQVHCTDVTSTKQCVLQRNHYELEAAIEAKNSQVVQCTLYANYFILIGLGTVALSDQNAAVILTGHKSMCVP